MVIFSFLKNYKVFYRLLFIIIFFELRVKINLGVCEY